jgi:hypothetical protein
MDERKGGASELAEKLLGDANVRASPVQTTPALGAPPLLI